MNTSIRFIAPLMLVLGASAAMAQSAEGLTRAQVQAEAREAARLGLLDIREGEFPSAVTATATAPSSSRAQLMAKAREAARLGLLDVREGEPLSLNAAAPSGEQKSRAQVLAEAREAARLGLLEYREGEAPRVATAEQAEQIRMAGLRAVDNSSVTAQGKPAARVQ